MKKYFIVLLPIVLTGCTVEHSEEYMSCKGWVAGTREAAKVFTEAAKLDTAGQMDVDYKKWLEETALGLNKEADSIALVCDSINKAYKQ